MQRTAMGINGNIRNMEDSHSKCSSDSNTNISRGVYDLDKINEYITSKSVVYDGKRVKWCGNYETLQEFVRTAFRQQGKWWLPGGNARRFDAFTSDFVVICYPGKLSTLTFKGESDFLAKKYLIDPNVLLKVSVKMIL